MHNAHTIHPETREAIAFAIQRCSAEHFQAQAIETFLQTQEMLIDIAFGDVQEISQAEIELKKTCRLLNHSCAIQMPEIIVAYIKNNPIPGTKRLINDAKFIEEKNTLTKKYLGIMLGSIISIAYALEDNLKDNTRLSAAVLSFVNAVKHEKTHETSKPLLLNILNQLNERVDLKASENALTREHMKFISLSTCEPAETSCVEMSGSHIDDKNILLWILVFSDYKGPRELLGYLALSTYKLYKDFWKLQAEEASKARKEFLKKTGWIVAKGFGILVWTIACFLIAGLILFEKYGVSQILNDGVQAVQDLPTLQNELNKAEADLSLAIIGINIINYNTCMSLTNNNKTKCAPYLL